MNFNKSRSQRILAMVIEKEIAQEKESPRSCNQVNSALRHFVG